LAGVEERETLAEELSGYFARVFDAMLAEESA
jgi:hypothetical protein